MAAAARETPNSDCTAGSTTGTTYMPLAPSVRRVAAWRFFPSARPTHPQGAEVRVDRGRRRDRRRDPRVVEVVGLGAGGDDPAGDRGERRARGGAGRAPRYAGTLDFARP